MKKLVAFVGAAVFALVVTSGIALAKPSWKKDVGAENCATCHLDDKKAANPGNKTWKAAKDMADKVAAGKGEFAGKSCGDCHKGQMKPPK